MEREFHNDAYGKYRHQVDKLFHSGLSHLRQKVDIVLVRPENSGNIGASIRAVQNMGILGAFHIVSSAKTQTLLNENAEKMAMHAKEAFKDICFYPDLRALLPQAHSLSLAATARIGSSHRPHPVLLKEAIDRAFFKLSENQIEKLFFVFGCESSGLSNEEISICDWVVTIPSHPNYRSLNLAQAVLLFCYELNMRILASEKLPDVKKGVRTQKNRLIEHVLELAKESGFVVEKDPYKMRPRLEEILQHFPNHMPYIKTMHGFIRQIIQTLKDTQIPKERIRTHG